jgi:hypothetical protein
MSGFRTKLDYSNNRQIKQFEKTNTILSGGTVFGLPFSGLTVGPNLDYSGVTNSYLYGLSTFSGNNTTTIFNWFDANMQIAEYAVTAITPTTSADTQELEYIFVGNNQGTLDGNTFYVDYSGISFDIHVNYMIDLGGGNYSGTVEHSYIDFLSASSLDYQSRTIWIDNPEITRTDRLIITREPQIGYVWTCIDSEGMGVWAAVSGGTSSSGNTLAEVLINGNSTGDNWIDVDITSSENGIRSNDISNKDKIIEFNPDGIDLSVYSNPYDNSTTISLTNEMIRLRGISDSGVFPVDEAYIDIYSTAGNIAMEGTGDLNINLETVTINGDVLTFSGAQYTNDFSGNFTNRSLVDKEYVDGLIASGTSQTLNETLINGNSTNGEDIQLTVGDYIHFSTTGSTAHTMNIQTIDNGGDNYTVRTKADYDNGVYSQTNVVDVDNLVGFSITSDDVSPSSQESNLYFSAGVNGLQYKHINKTTSNNYWFYTQNEGYTPSGGEPDYGVKTVEYVGDVLKIQKGRTSNVFTGGSQVMWRSDSLSVGHIGQYTIHIFGRKASATNQAQTTTIKFAAGWDTNKIPYFIGSENIEEWSNFSGGEMVDYTLSLDTTPNAGRIILTINHPLPGPFGFTIDYSIKAEELIKQPIF